MRRLVIYRSPNSTDRWSEAKHHDQAYYDDDRYYDGDRYRRSMTPYYDEDDYEYERSPRYRQYDDRSEYGRNDRTHYRNASFVLPNEDTANMIMNATAFGEYITSHGYHFTAALADCACKKMVNANHREHRWTSDLIRQQLSIHGITDLGRCTLGDITFLANMAYADFYPEVLPSEHACIKYAIAVAKDPDGYDGIVFSRWVADLIGKKIVDIDWERYV